MGAASLIHLSAYVWAGVCSGLFEFWCSNFWNAFSMFVDGAFSKNTVFWHVILCIAALDTNHKLSVLALRIAQCENTANWKWFLRQLLGTPLGEAISERIVL